MTSGRTRIIAIMMTRKTFSRKIDNNDDVRDHPNDINNDDDKTNSLKNGQQ